MNGNRYSNYVDLCQESATLERFKAQENKKSRITQDRNFLKIRRTEKERLLSEEKIKKRVPVGVVLGVDRKH